jgi:hypothetical protein
MLALLLIGIGCSKDDSGNDSGITEVKGKIVGEWLVINEIGMDNKGTQISTRSLKASDICEYDRLNFLPSGSVNYVGYFIRQEEKDKCNQINTPDAYRWGLKDKRRMSLSNGEKMDEFIIVSLDENQMSLQRMLTADEMKMEYYKKEGITQIKINYTRVK